MTLIKYVKNGLYIPVVHGIIYKQTQNMYLATIISMKLIPTNHLIWFGHTENISSRFVQLKQFVRFTDSGHLASFIYFFRPDFLPIAHNIHFLIMAGYWIGKLCGVKESGSNNDFDFMPRIQFITSGLNHGLIYGFLVRDIIASSTSSIYLFSKETLLYSYAWAYAWLFFIYMPWRYMTKDEVYSVLSVRTPIMSKISFFSLMHVLMYMGHYVGKRLTL